MIKRFRYILNKFSCKSNANYDNFKQALVFFSVFFDSASTKSLIINFSFLIQ